MFNDNSLKNGQEKYGNAQKVVEQFDYKGFNISIQEGNGKYSHRVDRMPSGVDMYAAEQVRVEPGSHRDLNTLKSRIKDVIDKVIKK